LFSIRNLAGAHANGFTQYARKRRDLTLGGPQFQLCVARCSKFDEIFGPAIVHLHTGDRLRMAAVERLGEAQNGR
jgi:hypothetical protein